MKMVYTHQNPALVGLAKNVLSENGIDAKLQNYYASGGAGELSPVDSWPELWVLDEAQFSIAKDLISDVGKNIGSDWICGACNEENGPSFAICWNCQTEKP